MYPTVPGASLGFDCEEIILIILFNFRQGYPLTDYCSLSWILIYFHKLISQAGFLMFKGLIRVYLVIGLRNAIYSVPF